MRQQPTAIFEQPILKPTAQRKIQAWIQRVQKSGLKRFDEFLKTMEHWWEETTIYFIDWANSGFVEGLNNKLEALKRCCYGIFN